MRNNKAFTLIELLVVVLIIGILAAIALPQYQKAVMRARVTEAIVNTRALFNALEVYRLENGSYPSVTDVGDLNELTDYLSIDISPLDSRLFTFYYYSGAYVGYHVDYEGGCGWMVLPPAPRAPSPPDGRCGAAHAVPDHPAEPGRAAPSRPSARRRRAPPRACRDAANT